MPSRFVRCLLGCLLLSALLPFGASAYPLVLTFDDGYYDPNMPELGGDLHGPYDWIENNGIRAAGFWAVNVGTPDSYYQQGHTHIWPNYSGRPDGQSYKYHSYTNDLQGLIISLESGQSFDVVSIDYTLELRDSTDPLLQRLDWAWGVDDAQMLLATSFDPTQADFSSEWTPFPIDDYGAMYPQWYTEQITGFDDVTSFYWSTTAVNVQIDTIVLEVHGFPVPEPGTGLLVGLGMGGAVIADCIKRQDAGKRRA